MAENRNMRSKAPGRLLARRYFSLCLCIGVLAVSTGCSGIAVHNIEAALADLGQAAEHVEAAVRTMEGDPALASASFDLVRAYGDVENAIEALGGGERGLTKSCGQRCAGCGGGGLEPDCQSICALNCLKQHHPVCPSECVQ